MSGMDLKSQQIGKNVIILDDLATEVDERLIPDPSGASDGDVLTVDAAASGGRKWATPASGGDVYSLVDFHPAYTSTDGWALAGCVSGTYISAYTTYLASGDLYALPFVPKRHLKVDALGVDVYSGHGATTYARMGIYSAATGALLPGALVADLGQNAITAAGLNTWTSSPAVSLTAGTLYHVVIFVTGITGSGLRLFRMNEDQMFPIYGIPGTVATRFSNNGPSWGVRHTGLTPGALPDPFPASPAYLGLSATSAFAIAMGLHFSS